jgi:hypothetical protein
VMSAMTPSPQSSGWDGKLIITSTQTVEPHLHFPITFYEVVLKNTGNIQTVTFNSSITEKTCRFQWPRSLRRESAAARLLELWVRIPPETWISVSCVCCVLLGRGFCVGLITRPEESYLVWCDWVWSQSLENEEALTHWGLVCHGEKTEFYVHLHYRKQYNFRKCRTQWTQFMYDFREHNS